MNSRSMAQSCAAIALAVMPAQAGHGADLLGHWDFNAEGGARVTDRSGRGHHGTIHGAPKREPGLSGEALRFAMAADFVDFGAAIIPARDFTISVWINCDDTEKQFFLGQYLYAHPSRLDLAKIHLDGKVITEARLPAPVIQTQPLMVGKIVVPNQDSFRFTGLMDELKVWDAALDAAEVHKAYQKLKR